MGKLTCDLLKFNFDFHSHVPDGPMGSSAEEAKSTLFEVLFALFGIRIRIRRCRIIRLTDFSHTHTESRQEYDSKYLRPDHVPRAAAIFQGVSQDIADEFLDNQNSCPSCRSGLKSLTRLRWGLLAPFLRYGLG